MAYRRCRAPRARAYRDVDDPIRVRDLLVMSQLGDNFARCRPFADERTSGDKVPNDDERLKIAVFLRARMVAPS
jgi:hypothetical protein